MDFEPFSPTLFSIRRLRRLISVSAATAAATTAPHLVIPSIIQKGGAVTGLTEPGFDFHFLFADLVLQILKVAVRLGVRFEKLFLRQLAHQKLSTEAGGHFRQEVQRRAEGRSVATV